MVVAGGATSTEDEAPGGVAVTLFNCTDVALLTCQLKVVFCPDTIEAGLAEKLVMTGVAGRGDDPLLLLPQLASRTTSNMVAAAQTAPRMADELIDCPLDPT